MMGLELTPSTISIIVYVAIFLGVLLAFEGVRQLTSRSENNAEARNRRMRMINRGAGTDEVLSLLRDPAMKRGGSKGGPIVRLRRLLLQAGVTAGLPVFFVGVAAFGVAVFVGLMPFLNTDQAVAAAILAALTLPFLLLSALKAQRSEKLAAQLPDALDLMSRAIKVGHPIAVTVGAVAKDMPDPIGSEFGIIQDQIAYGDDISTAFHDFAERVGTEDAKYLAVSVGIQHGTGGNLARILDVLSKVIRDRFTMKKKIKAISAEGRLSAVILTFLPALIAGSIHVGTPSFYGDVWNDPLFPYFAVVIVGLMILQGLILYKLVSFKF